MYTNVYDCMYKFNFETTSRTPYDGYDVVIGNVLESTGFN